MFNYIAFACIFEIPWSPHLKKMTPSHSSRTKIKLSYCPPFCPW